MHMFFSTIGDDGGRQVASVADVLSRVFLKNSIVLSKGKKWRTELNEIKNKWHFNLDVVNNNKAIDDSGGVVLIIRDLGKKK